MDFTLPIAILGCITGVLSLVIQFFQYISERPRVYLKTYNELNNIVCRKQTAVSCYLHLRVMNAGKKSALIQDIYLRRPKARKNILNNLVHYSRSLSEMPWRSCDNILILKKPSPVHILASVGPGEIFEVVLEFLDVPHECYNSDSHFLYPTLCVAFAPYKVKEIEIQAILTDEGNEFTFHDTNGKEWKL